jgi:hypothetical protein
LSISHMLTGSFTDAAPVTKPFVRCTAHIKRSDNTDRLHHIAARQRHRAPGYCTDAAASFFPDSILINQQAAGISCADITHTLASAHTCCLPSNAQCDGLTRKQHR